MLVGRKTAPSCLSDGEVDERRDVEDHASLTAPVTEAQAKRYFLMYQILDRESGSGNPVLSSFP